MMNSEKKVIHNLYSQTEKCMVKIVATINAKNWMGKGRGLF